MQKIHLWIIFYAYHRIIGTLVSSSVDCIYSNRPFWTVGYKYHCYVSNNLNISSPESAIIDAVNGDHESGKSNNDEIYFYAYDNHIEYFPRGLEKIFTNLTGIAIWYSQLKEIHQEDLKPYTKLKYLNLYSNNIEVIEDGLFDFQPNIEAIIFERSKIFHISSTVFDNLSKLISLHLSGNNNCISKESKNNRTGVLEIIKSVKSNCTSPEYIKLDEKLKSLEQSSKNLNADNFVSFKVDFETFNNDLNRSKLSNYRKWKNRIIDLLQIFNLWDKIEANSKTIQHNQINSMNEIEENRKTIHDNQINSMNDNSIIKNTLSEMNRRSANRSQWMIIATGVFVITQTILIVVTVICWASSSTHDD